MVKFEANGTNFEMYLEKIDMSLLIGPYIEGVFRQEGGWMDKRFNFEAVFNSDGTVVVRVLPAIGEGMDSDTRLIYEKGCAWLYGYFDAISAKAGTAPNALNEAVWNMAMQIGYFSESNEPKAVLSY